LKSVKFKSNLNSIKTLRWVESIIACFLNVRTITKTRFSKICFSIVRFLNVRFTLNQRNSLLQLFPIDIKLSQSAITPLLFLNSLRLVNIGISYRIWYGLPTPISMLVLSNIGIRHASGVAPQMYTLGTQISYKETVYPENVKRTFKKNGGTYGTP
jgi:hypothetical protein